MKPRPVTQEDADYWSQSGVEWIIGPMKGEHLGAENIPSVLKAQIRGQWVIKVAWELDERDLTSGGHDMVDNTLWTTFWGGMPACDLVIS